MTSIAETPLARLETENRLINVSLKEAGSTPGSFLFRGELAIKLAQKLATPALPPELKAEQVLIAVQAGRSELPFYACYLPSFASLKPMLEVLGETLGASGKYFVFCGNLPRDAEYQVTVGTTNLYVYAMDNKKSNVFADLLTLLDIEPDTVKKRGLGGKLEGLIGDVASFSPGYPQLTYERGLEVMSPA